MELEKPPNLSQPYPPDPHWGMDRNGWWRYTDYDGENLRVRQTSDGDLWIDKHGEGPVYVRQEDIATIVAAMTTPEMYPPRRRRIERLAPPQGEQP